MPVLQVAPYFGQNWLSSSSHGGATERWQYYNKWRHISDKTGYHHHHMVAPLSGVSSSSGVIFRTKTGYHHHHMVAPLSGGSIMISGAIFRTKTGYHHHHMVAPLSDASSSSGAIGQNWLSSSSHGGATERCQFFKWRHLPDQNWLSSSSHGSATETLSGTEQTHRGRRKKGDKRAEKME